MECGSSCECWISALRVTTRAVMPPLVRQGVLLGPRPSHEPTDMTTWSWAPVVSKWPQVGSSGVGTPLPSPQSGSSRSIVASSESASSRTAESAMCTVISVLV